MAGMQNFFGNVSKTKLLSREEEVMLAKRMEEGDESARAHMISANVRLAISIARKFQNQGCNLEDLIQEANIGLIKAVDRFDYKRGFKFSTYGYWWIKQAVMRYITSNSSVLRLPSYTRTTYYKIKEVREKYFEEFDCYPSNEEIADLLGVSVQVITSIQGCLGPTFSLNSSKYGAEDGRTMSDVIEDESIEQAEEVIDRGRLLCAIRASLDKLTAREEKIIRLRFGISEDIENHDDFPITKEEINNILEQK